MFLTLGYMFMAFARWCKFRYRKATYMRAVHQVFRDGSVMVQRAANSQFTDAAALLRSPLVHSSADFKEARLLNDGAMVLTEISPKQRVDMTEWTAYFRTQGRYTEDRYREDVMVLLEASRPANLEQFLEHENDVLPAERVHVLAHGAALAWKSGTPFGILLHCSLDEFVTLAMAFVDGALTMDEDLEVHSVLTVDTEGKAASLILQAETETACPGGDGTLLRPRFSPKKIVTNKNLNASAEGVPQIVMDEAADGGVGGAMQQDTDRNVNASSEGQSHLTEDLAHTLSGEHEQVMELWSNESLASNSSEDKAGLLEMEDGDLADGNTLEESGSGEGLSEMDLETSASTSSSLAQSWKVVRMSSIAKPPNILIYSGKKDSVRKFEEVRAVLQQCIDADCYVIYHLKHEDVLSTPWIDNTALLVLSSKNMYQDVNDEFHDFFVKGGKILSMDSSFDGVLLERQQVRPSMGITAFNFKSWSDVSLIGGRYGYSMEGVNTQGITVSRLATDSDRNTVIVKVEQKSKSGSGCAVLSQILFDKEPADLAVTQEMFNTLKKSNTDRFEILRELLTILGLECNPQSQPVLTPACLFTLSGDSKSSFLQSIESRLVEGVLKSGAQSLKFTEEAGEAVSESVLPVVTASVKEVGENFDFKLYTENLTSRVLGNTMLYVDVVPSTMTLLEGLMFSVPKSTGLIAVARQQTRGKGRGGNAWLSPVGCAMFTLHVQVPLETTLGRAVSFLQHITSLAVVNSVCELEGYKDIDLRLKWPNDIYYDRSMKLGGVIVKSTVMDGMVHATIGCGFNVSNSNPTICINDLIQLHNRQQNDSLQLCSVEQLIARTVSGIEQLIEAFQEDGADSFKQLYYQRWLHSDSIVTLQSEGDREVRVVGLDDYGYLLVETVEGEKISVQPDGNSFDMMQNLISMKTR